MTFKDLIDRNSCWSLIKKSFVSTYPDQEKNIEGYEYVFETLKTLTPESSKMTLYLERFKDEEFGDEWVHVFGKDGNMCELAPDKEESYSLELSTWEYWLGCAVDPQSIKRFGQRIFISHCLYEMTFFGFTQEKIKTEKDELDRRYQEAIDHPERLIPAEEVFKNIRDKIDKEKEKSTTQTLKMSGLAQPTSREH